VKHVRIDGKKGLSPKKTFDRYLVVWSLGNLPGEHRIYELPDELLPEAFQQGAMIILQGEDHD
jgi:hypothetical protein